MVKLDTLYTLISHLSKRERMIFYGAVFFVFMTLLDRLVIYPVSSKMNWLKRESEEKESSIRENLHILAQKDKILLQSSQYASFFSAVQSEEEEITAILGEIEALANKSSVYLLDLKPAGQKESGLARKYMVNLNCEAKMEQMIDFMYNIENSNRLLIIEKYQMNPKSKESSIAKCSVGVSKIVIP